MEHLTTMPPDLGARLTHHIGAGILGVPVDEGCGLQNLHPSQPLASRVIIGHDHLLAEPSVTNSYVSPCSVCDPPL